MEQASARTLLPLIEAGVKDGSIPTEYPREAAELLSLLPNYWLMPYFYPVTLPEMEHRIRCLATMLDAIGVPISMTASSRSPRRA